MRGFESIYLKDLFIIFLILVFIALVFYYLSIFYSKGIDKNLNKVAAEISEFTNSRELGNCFKVNCKRVGCYLPMSKKYFLDGYLFRELSLDDNRSSELLSGYDFRAVPENDMRHNGFLFFTLGYSKCKRN